MYDCVCGTTEKVSVRVHEEYGFKVQLCKFSGVPFPVAYIIAMQYLNTMQYFNWYRYEPQSYKACHDYTHRCVPGSFQVRTLTDITDFQQLQDLWFLPWWIGCLVMVPLILHSITPNIPPTCLFLMCSLATPISTTGTVADSLSVSLMTILAKAKAKTNKKHALENNQARKLFLAKERNSQNKIGLHNKLSKKHLIMMRVALPLPTSGLSYCQDWMRVRVQKQNQ
ncbi:hypothetical protein C8R44DRAFT_740787 [Mycena epipterygia]|nr:hypothetical protein C8R44DRAFT_740787 [Mycena epipterygia]